MIGAAFEGAAKPSLERVIGGFEGKDHDRVAAVARPGLVGLRGIEDPAVRRIESGLRDHAHRPRGGEEVAETDGGAGAKARPVLQSHPGLGDDAENALRADEEAIGARTGPGARQPTRLDEAARRHHPQAFDQVVDVGGERGEMAA